jgi:hypothetical protein
MKKGRTSKKRSRTGTQKPPHETRKALASSSRKRDTESSGVDSTQETTSGRETSSLDPNTNTRLKPQSALASAARRKVDAGDLQAVSNVEDSSTESTSELIDEGQDLEAEVVEAIEESADNRREIKPIKAHEPRSRVPRFADRNDL